MDTLDAQWATAWSALGVPPSPALAALHRDVVQRYGEPHRHYHTLQHLAECFALLDTLGPGLPNPGELRVALWFHDAIYDTHRHDNEALSADLAATAARSLGVPVAACDTIGALIMATRHAAQPQGAAAEILVDVDLAILGAKLTRFEEYERQIRAEYAWVAEDEFRRRRIGLLQHFLARPQLYATPQLRRNHEARARANMQTSILELGGP